jgi:signal transduction histidine kinase
MNAVDRIKDINGAGDKMSIRWVHPDSLHLMDISESTASIIQAVTGEGRDTSLVYTGSDHVEYLYTFSPVNGNNLDLGLIEIRESLHGLKAYTHETAVRVVILSIVLIVISLVLLWLLGNKYIGRPLGRLMEKTKRIGRGDFAQDLHLTGHHELSKLANSLNHMCGELEQAGERIKIETERRFAALEQLRHTERLATVGRLASGIAHELGTPLNVITGRAKLIMAEGISTDETNRYAGIIVDQSERITKIIRQLLDFARRRKTNRRTSSMYQLATHTIELLQPMARKAGVSIELTEDSPIPDIPVDRFQIQQVLVNLIMNGIQAMAHGGRLNLHISKKLERDPGHEDSIENEYLALEISDEGEGITPENLAHVFDPFFTTKEVGKGTGLGLSIAYGIVEDHRGWIHVESVVGKGSRFTIYLPLEVP